MYRQLSEEAVHVFLEILCRFGAKPTEELKDFLRSLIVLAKDLNSDQQFVNWFSSPISDRLTGKYSTL